MASDIPHAMSNAEFNAACRTEFYEPGKLPWPRLAGGSELRYDPTQISGWGWWLDDGSTGFNCPETRILEDQAACIIEHELRVGLEGHGRYIAPSPFGYALTDSWGCELADGALQKEEYQVALLAGVRKVLEEI